MSVGFFRKPAYGQAEAKGQAVSRPKGRVRAERALRVNEAVDVRAKPGRSNATDTTDCAIDSEVHLEPTASNGTSRV